MWLATRVSVRPLPWFHHSCIAWITSCRLCSSACSVGSCCSGGHTCHTLTVPCQDPLARPQQAQFGIRRAPSAPSSSCPWQRGLWGQHCPAEHRRAFSSCPAAPDPREGQQPMDTRSQCSRAWSHPCVRNSHGTSSPGSSALAHRSGTHCNRQGKNCDCSEMGLYGVYCSKHFIILQWDVLWSAKYYCKVKLRLFFFF